MRGRTQDDGSTPRDTRHDYWGVVLDAPDALALARFYAELLGWEIASQEQSSATIAPPDGVAYIGFQRSPEYVPPVWPPVNGAQQMMLHLDFEVDELEAAVGHASNSARERQLSNHRTRCESCWTPWVTRSVSTRTGER